MAGPWKKPWPIFDFLEPLRVGFLLVLKQPNSILFKGRTWLLFLLVCLWNQQTSVSIGNPANMAGFAVGATRQGSKRVPTAREGTDAPKLGAGQGGRR